MLVGGAEKRIFLHQYLIGLGIDLITSTLIQDQVEIYKLFIRVPDHLVIVIIIYLVHMNSHGIKIKITNMIAPPLVGAVLMEIGCVFFFCK